MIKDTIKNIIKSKFKEKMRRDKELEEKINLRYYNEVIDPNLEDKKYLFVLTSAKKKISIVKIRTKSHELHSETRVGQFLKRYGMKECVTFVTLRSLKMKRTFSSID